jgi:hypothetical protein
MYAGIIIFTGLLFNLDDPPVQIFKKIVLGLPIALAGGFLTAFVHEYSLNGTIKKNENNKIQ